MGFTGLLGKKSSTSLSSQESDFYGGLNPVSYEYGDISSSSSSSPVPENIVGYDDGWGNIVSSSQDTSGKKSFLGGIFSGIGNFFTSDSASNYSNNEKSNSMGVASGVVAGLAGISSSVADILTSGDKIEIAKYQAQGEVAKANAIIAEAQAKADAQAEAEKEKSKTTTYIIIGVFLLIIIIVVVLLSQKSPQRSQPYYPQYQIQKPTMPTNYVQSSPPPRQLQPIAPKA